MLDELDRRVCRRLSRLEVRVDELPRRQTVEVQSERLLRPFSVRLNAGDPDYFTVVLYDNESFWVLSTESEQAAEITCRRLNKFLTGLVVAPGSLDTVRTCQVKHAVGKPSQGQTGEAEGYQTVLIWSGGGPFQIWMRKGEDGYSVVFGPDDKQVMGSLSCGDAMKLCLKLNSHWAFSGKEKQ